KRVKRNAQADRQLGMVDVKRPHLISRHRQVDEGAFPIKNRKLVRQCSIINPHFFPLGDPLRQIRLDRSRVEHRSLVNSTNADAVSASSLLDRIARSNKKRRLNKDFVRSLSLEL